MKCTSDDGSPSRIAHLPLVQVNSDRMLTLPSTAYPSLITLQKDQSGKVHGPR